MRAIIYSTDSSTEEPNKRLGGFYGTEQELNAKLREKQAKNMIEGEVIITRGREMSADGTYRKAFHASSSYSSLGYTAILCGAENTENLIRE